MLDEVVEGELDLSVEGEVDVDVEDVELEEDSGGLSALALSL
ncbi:MAG: hypothetical protein NVSMB14_04930 [Isosphaeraceae bacterium]